MKAKGLHYIFSIPLSDQLPFCAGSRGVRPGKAESFAGPGRQRAEHFRRHPHRDVLCRHFFVGSSAETYGIDDATGQGVRRKRLGLHYKHFYGFGRWQTAFFLGNPQGAPANFFKNRIQYRKLG